LNIYSQEPTTSIESFLAVARTAEQRIERKTREEGLFIMCSPTVCNGRVAKGFGFSLESRSLSQRKLRFYAREKRRSWSFGLEVSPVSAVKSQAKALELCNSGPNTYVTQTKGLLKEPETNSATSKPLV